MHISTVNNNAIQTHFGAIYKTAGKYSEQQNSMAETIMKSMQSEKRGFDNQTVVDKFEKNGYNFLLKPAENDSVLLSICRKVKNSDGNLSYHKSQEHSIGIFNKDLPFEISEIDGFAESITKTPWLGSIVALFLLAGVTAFGYHNHTPKSTATKKAITETVDNISSKTEVLKPNTVRYLDIIK